MDVVGIGDQFPLHAFGSEPLFAAVHGQLRRFCRVVNPCASVNVGLELAMRHEVGVATNGGGEVHIGVQVQTEMAAVIFVVAGALHELEEPLVDDAAGCFRQLAGGSLCLLKRGQNAVAGFGVDDAREIVGHRFSVFGFGFFHAREVDAAAAQTCPVAQQIGQFIGFAFTVLAQAGHGELYPDVQRRQFGVQPLHLWTVRRGVAAPRKRGASGAEQVADRRIGGDHEGLDHPRGFVGPLHLNTQLVFTVEARAQFRIVEI